MEKMLKINVLDETINVPYKTSVAEIAEMYADRFKSPITVARTDNILRELSHELTCDTSLELLDMTDVYGMRVYQRGVIFLLVAAVNDVLGKDKQLVVCHAIKKNIYCEIKEHSVSKDEILALERKMKELADADLPLVKSQYQLDEAIDVMKELGMIDKARLFKYRNNNSVNLYELDGVFDYFYGFMTPSTGCLKWFKLVKEDKGLVLMFPTPESPSKVDEYSPLEIISDVFKEYKRYGRILGINTAGDLNCLIAEGKFYDTVRIEEALQEKKIASIADKILEKDGVKLILVAGPSSSGKTTFAHRLAVLLRVNGIKTLPISLDDYFRNRAEAPLDENGNPNFEALEFLNIELLNENLNRLIDGEEIIPPKYNFTTGISEMSDKPMKLERGEIIIAEGIHALNAALTGCVENDTKFKIFISALTPLSIDNHNRISTSDNRLIRRLVRDYRARGASAERTIGMWPSVLAGEAKYIFPTQNESDVVFNSSLIYELAVLKQFAEPLLYSIGRESELFTECKRLIRFLSWFLGAPTEEIPQNSIIREFIGRSCFHV